MGSNSHFLIGATSSGCGKTTLTLGLHRALKNRGIKTQPFKCGPDYIDTKYHEMASGKPSVNLDRFLASDEHIKQLYDFYSSRTEVCITEGVMGLFDGYDRQRGSSAEIANLLDIPVILVVNAKSTAYSVAPLLYGYKHFYDGYKLAGVIFNQVASENHFSLLKQACEDVGVVCFGYMPFDKEIIVPSRHLGLSIEALSEFETFAGRTASLVEKYINIEALLEATKRQICNGASEDNVTHEGNRKDLQIAIAKDEAFNFMYEDNIRALEKLGEVKYFSPLHDRNIPDIDFLYLPGGYPEFFLAELSENQSMKSSLRNYVEKGGKILAECGGMMYLCKSIIGTDNKEYPMTGIFDMQATMKDMKLKLGYREGLYNNHKLRGHEFHYSRLVPETIKEESVAAFQSARGMQVDTALYRKKNVIAGYTHLYWGEFNILELWQ